MVGLPIVAALLQSAVGNIPQDVPAASATRPPQQEAPSQDGEIVVTARRRSENIQDVPIAVSVVSGDTLDETGSYNVSRLQQMVPTLQFFSSNPRNTAVNIRGIGAPFGLTNDGIEQGVGIYIDQVYYSRIASATFDFLDVDRIEVLRGPQGTLYGKNTTAGAISITTAQPSFDFEGRAELSIGNLQFKQARASISGPLSDTVAARLAISATSRRGTLYNVATNSYVNAQDNIGVRGQLLWRVRDGLDVTLAADYNRQDPACCAQLYVRTGATQRPLNRQYDALAAAQGYAVPSTNAFDRLVDVDARLNATNELGGISLRAEYQLGSDTLTSVTAWRFWDWSPANDRDYIGLPITTRSENPSHQDQFTQEFRYAAEGRDFDYLIGLFGFHQKIHTDGVQEQGSAASAWLINPTNPLSADPSVLDGLIAYNQIDFSNTSLAAFGQLTWHANDRLRIQPGIRINYDSKHGSYDRQVLDGNGDPVLFTDTGAVRAAQLAVLSPQFFEPEFSAWNVSGDLSISYEISGNVMAYASYARAFRSGGINVNGVPNDANNQPILATATVAPEKVNHYEIGLKTQTDDRRATFNLTGFWTDIFDYQANVVNGQVGVLRGYLANADHVRVRGVEAEFAWRPTERFSLYANGAWTDHEYVKFEDAPCPPELSGGGSGTPIAAPGQPGNSPANCDISGQWLPGISNWAFSYGGEYSVPANLFGLPGSAYLGYDGSWRSKFSSNASRSAYTDIAGYEVSNFRIGFRSDDGLNAFLWVRNAFDSKYFTELALASGNSGLIVGSPGDQRTFGLTIAKNF